MLSITASPIVVKF